MNWQTLLKKLKGLNYKGAENDLAAVKKFIEDELLDLEVGGKAVDVDALHAKAYPGKTKLDLTGDAKDAEIEALRAQLEAKDTEDELLGKKKAAERQVNKSLEVDVKVGQDRAELDPKGGFVNFGHFLQEVTKCPGVGNETMCNFSPREGSRLQAWTKTHKNIAQAEGETLYKSGLITKATLSTYSAEGTGVDGGFAVPPEFRAGITNRIEAQESIAARCDKATMTGNTVTATIDTTTPWQTSGGILVYWIGEQTAITQSKLALNTRTFTLRKACALVPLTEELTQDASFLGSYITNKAGTKLGFAVDKAIMGGDGITQPTGVVGHAGTVSVAKETNQTATTIKASNIQKMWMSCEPSVRSRSIWIVNPDCQVQLQRMFVQGTKDSNTFIAAGGLVYLPANGLAGAPNDTIMGRPIVYHQAAQTLGTVGDITLFCPDQYLVCTKAEGVQSASSIHLWFDQAVNAMRFLYRVEGQPWWPTTVSALNGSQTYGAFVTCATR